MSSFVGEFNKYLKTRTDAPPDFHIHAAMVALAFAAGNRVWLPGYGRKIYPNLWVVIIARSGMGKSVPLDLAERVLRKASLSDGFLPESFSQEALLTAVKQHPNGMFILQEFSAFVKGLEREYNAGSMAWLTALYDVPDEYTRMVLRKGELEPIKLEKPCISILGASSPDWFADSFKEQQLRGGFLARFLFCPSNKSGEYIDYPGPLNEGIEDGLACNLNAISELSGEFDMSGVMKQYNDWQKPQREKLKNSPPEFAGIRSRAGMMVMKAAMLFHLSTDPTSMTITAKDLDNAIRYVENSHRMAEKFLAEEVPTSVDESKAIKLLNVVKRSEGRVSWASAMMNSHLSARDMDATVKTLEQTERVYVETTNRKRYLCLPIYTNGVVH